MMASISDEVYKDDDFSDIFELLEYRNDDKVRCGDSRCGRAANIDRDRSGGRSKLFNDYFSQEPIYPDYMFTRRFRVSRRILLRISTRLKKKSKYFQVRKDATGKEGFDVIQKYTAAMRLISYGVSGDSIDEYLRMGEPTALKSLKNFAEGVVECFKDEYPRTPNRGETEKLLQRADYLGFPGMLGSIDCCKWVWKNSSLHDWYQLRTLKKTEANAKSIVLVQLSKEVVIRGVLQSEQVSCLMFVFSNTNLGIKFLKFDA